MSIGNRACIVDCYSGDGAVEPLVLRANGADALCVKAGQGNWQDARFKETWARAKGILPRQAYWFLDPRYSLTDHIKAILAALGNDPGEMPLLQDYEANSKLGIALAPLSWLYQIDGAILKAIGRPTMIYTNQNYWTMGNGLTYPWAATRDLFTAQYPFVPNPSTGQPKVYAPWRREGVADAKVWRAWQFTDHGTMPGMESKSRDISVFNGTVAEMNAWIATFGAPPEPPDTPLFMDLPEPLRWGMVEAHLRRAGEVSLEGHPIG